LSVINAQNYSSGIDVGADLTPRITTESEILVMGISQRTNNTAEARSSGVIPKTWERFMKEGLLQKIPNRTDANIIALYTDYASDKDGDYSFVLGAKVTDGGQVPSGMVLKRIPSQERAMKSCAQ
jgi:predicted transcriptional regulator YdeE